MKGFTRHAIAATAMALVASHTAVAQTRYVQTNLVSSVSGLGLVTDPDLKNPWGISDSPSSPFWVSDAAGGVATLYTGAGSKSGLVVTIPGSPSGVPTGQVFNSAGAFTLSNSLNASFLFATANGTIAGWNTGTTAQTMVDLSGLGAVYTGLAISGSGPTARLYAANFGLGRVDVFDGSFVLQSNAFVDPNLPSGYSPYNVQTIGSTVYVTYAVKDPITGRVVPGAGNGIVDSYSTSGALLSRFATAGALNTPWGVALAPSTFGSFGGALLVANFGDGRISGYDAITGTLIGQLTDANGAIIVNSGLRGIVFGNANVNADANSLYFTAGINNQADGLFGRLSVVAAPEPGTVVLTALGLFGLVVVSRRRRSRVIEC